MPRLALGHPRSLAARCKVVNLETLKFPRKSRRERARAPFFVPRVNYAFSPPPARLAIYTKVQLARVCIRRHKSSSLSPDLSRPLIAYVRARAAFLACLSTLSLYVYTYICVCLCVYSSNSSNALYGLYFSLFSMLFECGHIYMHTASRSCRSCTWRTTDWESCPPSCSR